MFDRSATAIKPGRWPDFFSGIMEVSYQMFAMMFLEEVSFKGKFGFRFSHWPKYFMLFIPKASDFAKSCVGFSGGRRLTTGFSSSRSLQRPLQVISLCVWRLMKSARRFWPFRYLSEPYDHCNWIFFHHNSRHVVMYYWYVRLLLPSGGHLNYCWLSLIMW